MDLSYILRSDATGEPFTSCVMCEGDLGVPGVEYLIEKAFRAYRGFQSRDTVFEYAICLDCAEKVRRELSEESRAQIEGYFHRHREAFEERLESLNAGDAPQPGRWLDTCIFKGTPVSELDEFQVVCECQGPSVVFGLSPYVVGGPALDELAELLSNRTIDTLDDFAGQYLGAPPELEPLLRPRPILL